MPQLIVVKRSGESVAIDAPVGESVMEIARQAGIDEILAMCGGSCSCATCHVKVDEAFLPLLPPLGPDENDLLDTSSHRESNSRLACQIMFTEELDGLRVTIAPED